MANYTRREQEQRQKAVGAGGAPVRSRRSAVRARPPAAHCYRGENGAARVANGQVIGINLCAGKMPQSYA